MRFSFLICTTTKKNVRYVPTCDLNMKTDAKMKNSHRDYNDSTTYAVELVFGLFSTVDLQPVETD